MRAWVGFAMLVSLFMSLFVIAVISIGWMQAVLVFLLAAFILLWIKVAVDLMEGKMK